MPDPTPFIRPALAPRVANLYAVASGKGGVGKTWFAITLCHVLAARTQRVLLCDGDLGLANVDIQLGLMPEHDLGAVVEGKVMPSKAVTHFGQGPGVFDILAGRSGSGSLATLTIQQLNGLRDAMIGLAADYDYAVIDLGAGVDRATRHLAGAANTVFVLLNDEPTSLTDAYAFIKLARRDDARADLRVVVNLAANAAEGTKTYETLRKVCENFLNYTPPLAGIIRRDAKVREAIRAQTALMIRSPESGALADIRSLADKNLPRVG